VSRGENSAQVRRTGLARPHQATGRQHAHGALEGEPVGDGHDGAAGPGPPQEPDQGGGDPGAGLGLRLPAASPHVGVGRPGGVLGGEPGGGLIPPEPFPAAEGHFPQAAVGRRDQPAADAEHDRRLVGPPEIAGDDRRRPQAGDELRRPAGLLPAEVVERRIGLALEAAFGVPGRPAVAHEHEALIEAHW